MKLLILGAGGIGGYLGVRLAASGQDVTFLVRGNRLTTLRSHGIRLESPKGGASINPVQVVDEARGLSPDIVVIACKAWDLGAAIEVVRPCVVAGAVVLTVLNGMRHYEQLASEFGPDQIIGGAVYASVDVPMFGVVRHLGASDRFVIGAWNGSDVATGACSALLTAMAKANIEVEQSRNMQLDAWEKFTRVCTLAAVTCLFQASIGEIVATDHGQGIALGMLDESIAVATAAGFAPREAHVRQSRSRLSEPGSALTASMMRDMCAGGRTEADVMVGDMVHRARQFGIEVPLLKVAWTRLQIHETRLSTTIK